MEMSERLEKLKVLQNRCMIDQAMWKNDLIEVGDFTYGRPIVLQWDKHTRLKIGKFCSIGANVQIYLGGEHHTDWCTTYPFDVLIDGEDTATKGDVTIGNDVWLGNNATILSGVTIGDGAVIANGAVVTKDVQPYTVMAGVPAKAKKMRLCWTDMMNMHWWDWPLEKIAMALPMLTDYNPIALKKFDKEWTDEKTVFFGDRAGT